MTVLEPALEIKKNDPNDQQRLAAKPSDTVWVSASAGTGKTKVLTDRVMRLLLPRDDGQDGTPPHKILCLTFTKAAASEMYNRITETLSTWVILDEDTLTNKLDKLLGHAPTDYQMETARRLFADVVDVPGGLKIMTIHAFCQSLLGRFPLEAGLRPGFEAIDEYKAAAAQKQAMEDVLNLAAQNPDHLLAGALARLLRAQNREQIEKLLGEVISERVQFISLLSDSDPLADLQSKIYASLGLPANATKNSIITEYLDLLAQDKQAHKFKEALAVGGKRDLERREKLSRFLSASRDDQLALFDMYKSIYLTTKDEASKQGPGKAVLAQWEGADQYFDIQKGIVEHVATQLRSLVLGNYTFDLLTLSYAILDVYEARKKDQGWLDFDDLIIYAKNLLTNNARGAAAWVQYKLDGGIDHVLVDEAQDTNPDQWSTIEGLVAEFFSGNAMREDITRTLFVVGDDKQSIYSFQRADPDIFHARRAYFKQRVESAQQKWSPVDLITSFRSTQAILSLVDEVFQHMKTQHISYREGQAGRIELWPLYGKAEKPKPQKWQLPTEIIEPQNAMVALAKDIAAQIRHWLDTACSLPSHDRPIRPRDIMILVRSRNALFTQIIRELKRAQIPISGADRMVVKDQLAVEDLHALCAYAILPDDDLTLATVLKTPFISMAEETLCEIAYGRKHSLWDAVKEKADPKIVRYLQSLIERASYLRPHDFMLFVLQHPCPMDEVSGLRALQKRLGQDVIDPIEECLNQALTYETDHTPSLQHYLHYIQSQNTQIKREQDSQNDVVRIMTVHGSKGLQAPIVFLPDTLRTSNSKSKLSKLLWPSRTNLPAPIWAPSSELFSKNFNEKYVHAQNSDSLEYDRLLYVALTRAEEWLIIGGYETGHKALEDQSWYHQIARAMVNLDITQETFETSYDSTYLNVQHKKVYEEKRTKPADKSDQTHSGVVSTPRPLPGWALQIAPDEPFPPRPLSPSRPSEDDTDTHVNTPLIANDSYRFRRGNLTHELLEYLPELPSNQWAARARTYLDLQASDMTDRFKESVCKEVLKIMEAPELKPLFTSPALSEAPVTALTDKNIITGQIDRIAFVNDEVWIIDYKTNRPPPKTLKEVPQIYYKQMTSYRDLLREVYPQSAIRTFLLWTDGPRLMELL